MLTPQAIATTKPTATKKIGVDMEFFTGKKVALTRVGNLEISTVELPRFLNESRVVYETCIFPDEGNSYVVARYESIDEAKRSHAKIVAHEKSHLVAKKQHENG